MLNFNFAKFYSRQRYTMEPTSKLLIPDTLCTKRGALNLFLLLSLPKKLPTETLFQTFLD